MTGATTQVGTLRRAAKATSSRLHQLQRRTHTERGQSLALGTCAPSLAVDHAQDRPQLTLRAGFIRMVTSKLLPGSISVTLRGRATLAAPRLFHSVASRVSSTARLNTLAVQQVFQYVADRNHVSHRLSKPGSSAGFKTSWKDLTCEAEPLSPDDKIHD